ncbi:MAG: hypothetical protein V1725_06260 [archaeon]
MKKGVELSMNVIIIAAIALVVLVILVVLVLNSAGPVADTNKCGAGQGMCIGEGDECGDGYIVQPLSNCPTATPKCCVPFGGEQQ